MAVNEELVFINSIPLIVNAPNPEDINIYHHNLDIAYKTLPGRIVHWVSSMLTTVMENEKAKGMGIEIDSLAKTIDQNISDYNQDLIDNDCDYFIIKDFHCYVYINTHSANIVFLSKFSGGKRHEKDPDSIERVQETTKRVIDAIFYHDKHLRDLYEEEGEAILYLYGYNIINKKAPLSLFFYNTTCEEWLAKFGKTLKDYPYLYSSNEEGYYYYDEDTIEEAEYGDEDYDDEDDDYYDYPNYDPDKWDSYEDYLDYLNYLDSLEDDDEDDEDDDDEDDYYGDDTDLPPLPWN